MTANPHASPSFRLQDGREVTILQADGNNWIIEIQRELGRNVFKRLTRMDAYEDLRDSTFAEIETYCLGHDAYNSQQEAVERREIAAGRHA